LSEFIDIIPIACFELTLSILRVMSYGFEESDDSLPSVNNLTATVRTGICSYEGVKVLALVDTGVESEVDNIH
jgi:hypothetical protein